MDRPGLSARRRPLQLLLYLQMNRWQALRFVQSLVAKGLAAEDSLQDRKVSRIFSSRIFRALGTEDTRRRRMASAEILLRCLLVLDYVLEHPGLPWLPTEPEKVRAFEALGIERRRLPLPVYRGAVGETRRHFRLKLPIALETDRTVFVYVDPGYETATALRSWGAAHRGLWRALRERDRRVEVVVVAREHRCLQSAYTVLGHWADNFEPAAREDEALAGEEFARIEQAILTGNVRVLEEYRGVHAALNRTVELEQLARKRSHKTMIEGFATWRSTRTARERF